MAVYSADSECFKQLYVWVVVREEDKEEFAFFDRESIMEFFEGLSEDDLVITKNGLGYDWVMYLFMERWDESKGNFEKYMRKINDDIIVYGKYRRSAAEMQEKLNSKFPFKTIDTQELMNMRANLKRAAGSLGYHTVKDSDIHFAYDGEFTNEMISQVVEYGWSDCWANLFIFRNDETQTEMLGRKIMTEEFGVDVSGLGRPRLMSYMISELFRKQTGLGIWEAKQDFWRAPKKLHFGKILAKVGKDSRFGFDHPELKELYKDVMTFQRDVDCYSARASVASKAHYSDGMLLPISEQRKNLDGYKYDRTIALNGRKYRFKEGGLHSEHDERGEFYVSDDRHQLYDIDFTAFYPGLLKRFNIFPEWMLDAGFDIAGFYNDVLDKNLSEKAKPDGNKMLRYVYKIVCNLFYGKYGEPTDPLGDVRLQLKTCLTGQMILLRLIERLEAVGMRCVYANTDGIVISCPRGLGDRMRRILREFSEKLDIGIDPVEIFCMFLKNCNSYVWEMGDGKVKTKKDYSTYLSMINPTLKYPIVSTAAINYLLYGKEPIDTINECDDISQFCQVVSASSSSVNIESTEPVTKEDRERIKLMVSTLGQDLRGYHLEGKLKQSGYVVAPKNLRGYVASTGGKYYYKIFHTGKVPGRVVAQSNTNTFKLVMDYREVSVRPDDIDTQFYLNEVAKLVGEFKPVKRLEDIFDS